MFNYVNNKLDFEMPVFVCSNTYIFVIQIYLPGSLNVVFFAPILMFCVFFCVFGNPWKEDVGVLFLHCGGDVRMWIAACVSLVGNWHDRAIRYFTILYFKSLFVPA
jgi:hypothetical protein